MSMKTAATARTSSTKSATVAPLRQVLKTDGLDHGDRVAVFLSQSLELPIAHLAAFRSGMVSIPLFALFGEDALEFAGRPGAQAVVTDDGGWHETGQDPRPSAGAAGRLRPRGRSVGRDQRRLAVARWTTSEEFATVDTRPTIRP